MGKLASDKECRPENPFGFAPFVPQGKQGKEAALSRNLRQREIARTLSDDSEICTSAVKTAVIPPHCGTAEAVP